MALEITPFHDSIIVTIPCRLDANNAPAVETELKTLLTTNPKKIILNFSDTDYLASAGLRVILFISREFMKSGGRIALIELQPSVLRIFDMAGFTRIFTICVSREEALRKMV
ncbi:MAG: STAS domain-containing protein [Methanoregula sp.]|nr:STAS domain-containing protein [Methanoregula sp.]